MRYCPECGTENKPTNKFCEKCGERFLKENKKTVTGEEKQQNVTQCENTHISKNYSESAENYNAPTQSSKINHTGVGKASLILGIMGIIIGILFMWVWILDFFLGLSAIVLGIFGYWGSGINEKRRHDIYGLLGIILGLIGIIGPFIFYLLIHFFNRGAL